MTDYKDFIEDWDFQHPDETRIKFLQHLIKAREANDKDCEYQIQTQIARTFALEMNFEEAHKILNDVEKSIALNLSPRLKVRYYLERGRAYNSSKVFDKAREHFEKAVDIAKESKEEFLYVDALHMMGIVEKDSLKQIEWNKKAIAIAESSQDEKTRGWLGSLLNNTGWSLHDLKQYEEALNLFEKALELRKTKGERKIPIAIAMWCVARVHRSLENFDTSLELQLEVQKYRQDNNLGKGSYNYEELGELYLQKKEQELSQKNFKVAYELLSQDKWFVTNEPKRLERIKRLAKISENI